MSVPELPGKSCHSLSRVLAGGLWAKWSPGWDPAGQSCREQLTGSHGCRTADTNCPQGAPEAGPQLAQLESLGGCKRTRAGTPERGESGTVGERAGAGREVRAPESVSEGEQGVLRPGVGPTGDTYNPGLGDSPNARATTPTRNKRGQQLRPLPGTIARARDGAGPIAALSLVIGPERARDPASPEVLSGLGRIRPRDFLVTGFCFDGAPR
nr:uncharacterized protein LOC109730196 [Microcebus murinus]